MCSWFCGTFCCFLVRCRDSCIQSTSTPIHHRNRSYESHGRQGVREPGELSTLSYNATRGDYIIDLQPPSRSPMPQYSSSLGQSRDKSLPPPRDTFDGGGGPSVSNEQSREHATSHVGRPRLRGSSNIGVDHAIVDERAGDISLLSPLRPLHSLSHPRTQHPQSPPSPSSQPHPQQHPSEPPHPDSQSQQRLASHSPHLSAQEQFLNPLPSQQFQPFLHEGRRDRDPSAVVDSIVTQPTPSDFAAVSAFVDYTPDAPQESEAEDEASRVLELEGTLSIPELEVLEPITIPELSSTEAWQEPRE